MPSVALLSRCRGQRSWRDHGIILLDLHLHDCEPSRSLLIGLLQREIHKGGNKKLWKKAICEKRCFRDLEVNICAKSGIYVCEAMVRKAQSCDNGIYHRCLMASITAGVSNLRMPSKMAQLGTNTGHQTPDTGNSKSEIFCNPPDVRNFQIRDFLDVRALRSRFGFS